MKLELYDTFYRVHVFPKQFRDFISLNLSLHFKIPELLIKENRFCQIADRSFLEQISCVIQKMQYVMYIDDQNL